jgi:membrane protease YdiL (CAAX protease family)
MMTDPLDAPRPYRLATTLWDLILYLLVGLGLFAAASLLVVAWFGDRPLLLTAGALLANFLALSATVYLLGIRRRKVTWAQLGLRPLRWQWRWVWWAIGLALVFIPLRAALGLLVELLLSGNLDSLEARSDLLLGGGATLPGFLITLIGAGLLVPVAEELFFRGLLHNWFRQRLSLWPAALCSGALFGLAHFDSVGVVVASFIMGVVCAIAYEQTHSILLPIGIHAVTNSTAVILLYAALVMADFIPL